MNELTRLLDTQQQLTMTVAFVPRVVAAILVFLAFCLPQRLPRPALQAALRRARIDAALITILVDNRYRFVIMTFGLVTAVEQLGIDVTRRSPG